MLARVTIELDETVSPAIRVILRDLPGIQVEEGRPTSRLSVNGASVALALTTARQLQDPVVKVPIASDPDTVTVVVADRLPDHVRQNLAREGYAYVDGTGAAHFDVPGMLLHLEGRPNRRPRTVAPRGLGVVGVRAVQTLLAEPNHEWSIPDLREAADCSSGEAHRVFSILEENGLVVRVGRTRTLRRRVERPDELLDWLALVPAARRIRERLDVSIYARDVDALVAHISERALDRQLVYAITGAAASRLWGAGATTSIPRTMVRIDPEVPLEMAATVLDATPVDEGANVRLVRDFGELGTHDRAWRGPTAIANRARVWLDLLGETRGEDAAARFREVADGR